MPADSNFHQDILKNISHFWVCFLLNSLASFLFKFMFLLWLKSFSLLFKQSWGMEEQTSSKLY